MRRSTQARRALAILALAVTLVPACGSSTSTSTSTTTQAAGSTSSEELAPDQTLRFATGQQPRSLDPGQSTQALFPHLYSEALLRLNKDGTDVAPAAAATYDRSSDGLTFTFRLRNDGRYNDAQAVTARDFVYAWRRLIDPRIAAPKARIFASVIKGGAAAAALDPKGGAAPIDAALNDVGLQAVDDTTFRVTLAYPAADFKWIATLIDGAPVRQDVVDKFGSDKWATKPESLITNGPFRISTIAPGQSITLVPNDSYRVKPKLHAIVITKATAATEWTKYLNGEADIAFPPEAALHDAKTDPVLSKQVVRIAQPSVEWTTFNTSRAPFDNLKVRQAFAEAVDRQAYVTTLLPDGEAQPMSSLIPHGMSGYSGDLPGAQRFDPAKARADLAASGVDPGQLNGLHVLTGSYFVRQTEFLRDQIQKNLGITLTIDSVGDFPSITSAVSKGQFQIYDLDYLNAPYPDPKVYFDLFLAGNPGNSPRWSNPEYDALVRQADIAADATMRLQLYQQAENILLQQAPISMLYQFYGGQWVKPWVRGVVVSPFDDSSFPGDLDVTSIYIVKH